MVNEVINAVIALVENRPKDAREILRNSKVSSSALQIRLSSAIYVSEQKAIVKTLKDILASSLRVDIKKEIKKTTPAQEEAFIQGITYVEELIDREIRVSESSLKVTPGSHPESEV